MVAKNRVVYLCVANSKGCLWRERDSPWLDVVASLMALSMMSLLCLSSLLRHLQKAHLDLWVVWSCPRCSIRWWQSRLFSSLERYFCVARLDTLLGIEPSGGKRLDSKKRLSNQTSFLKIHHKQRMISHTIARRHYTGMSTYQIRSCPYAINRFWPSEERYGQFSCWWPSQFVNDCPRDFL